MLVDGNTMMKHAMENMYAIPAFGFVNLEGAKAIINSAESQNSPVILQITQGGAKYGGLEVLFVIALMLANRASVPVAIHLDHGRDLDLIKRAINLGFTSVMYDGSEFGISENAKNSLEIKKYIGKRKISLEIEVGVIGGKEEDVEADKTVYADIEEIKYIDEIVNPTMIAIAAGTAHGLGHTDVEINNDLIREATDSIKAAVVLHGASGVEELAIIKAVESGVRKVNFDTELKKAYIDGVKDYVKNNPLEYDIRKILQNAISEQEKIISKRIRQCGANNKNWLKG